MNIGEALPRNAQQFPQKLAIVDRFRALTFGQFYDRVNRLARYLLQSGIARGDLVALSCGSRAEHFEVLFAAAKIGAIAVPFDFHWSRRECEAMVSFFDPKAYVLENRPEMNALIELAEERVPGARLLVIDGAQDCGQATYERTLRKSSPEEFDVDVRGTDTFILMITSGTTGFPKACEINHETYALRCLNYGLTKGMNPNERALMALPVHFNAGRGSVMSILYLGGTIFIQEKFQADEFLETVAREKITYTMLVPTLCERLLRCTTLDKTETSSLRYIGITGGHLGYDLARETRERLCTELYEAYASTDCGQMTSLGPGDWEMRGDTVGRPIWCVLMQTAGFGGEPLARGEEGEICVRTPLAIQGYYRNSDATNDFLSDGWCHTGDIGFIDNEGFLHISGRKKNMIKSGGVSLFPEEIESILRKHPAVGDVAVLGFNSPEWGEAVKAFIVPKPGIPCSGESLISFCKETLASYKAPKEITFLSEIPRTGLGKIDRSKLEQMTAE